MNHLFILDTQAGDLEKILSGIKTMLLHEFDPAQITAHPVNPGDSLYFLRNKDDCALRVKATVVRVLFFSNLLNTHLSQTLKELQTRLQLTEDQYNYWSVKQQAMLVEFECAQKIDLIYVAPNKIANRLGWIPFESFDRITE